VLYHYNCKSAESRSNDRGRELFKKVIQNSNFATPLHWIRSRMRTYYIIQIHSPFKGLEGNNSTFTESGCKICLTVLSLSSSSSSSVSASKVSTRVNETKKWPNEAFYQLPCPPTALGQAVLQSLFALSCCNKQQLGALILQQLGCLTACKP
jgi:hypothetical protein